MLARLWLRRSETEARADAEVKADQRQRGRFFGGSVPFGWRREGDELIAVPEQQAAIGRMRKLRAKGLSMGAIRDRMADEGVRVSHVAVGNALRARHRVAASASAGGSANPRACSRRLITLEEK